MNPPPVPPYRPPQAPSPVAPRLGDDAAIRLLIPVGRCGWAIAAGYLGLFSLVILPAPFALGASILAIRQIRKSAGTERPLHGMGRAIFGLVMGTLGTLVLLLFVASFVARKFH